MLDQVTGVLGQLYGNVRLLDGVDVVVVSVIFYFLLVWFREAASRRALIGLFVLTAIYFAARILDLYLTSLILHTGFAVVVIMLIVVFQEDLRRILERIPTWGLMRRERSGAQGRTHIDVLVESIYRLATQREGALIVIRGTEPIDRHLDGGLHLDGKVSQPLLYSLFDSSSPGHDGALILEGDRVDRFGVHLPISKNHKEIRGRGTRHSAALGLSECCDALTIVVSEERGTVSVACSGKLKEYPTAAALKKTIDEFLSEKRPVAERRSLWSTILIRHWPLKIAALALSILAWLTIAYSPATVQRTFLVPIQYKNLSDGLNLDETAPHEARLTLSGYERNFRFLEPSTLTVSVDLGNAEPGRNEIRLEEHDIRLPANLTLYRIEPQTFRLNLKLIQKAPIEPNAPETR